MRRAGTRGGLRGPARRSRILALPQSVRAPPPTAAVWEVAAVGAALERVGLAFAPRLPQRDATCDERSVGTSKRLCTPANRNVFTSGLEMVLKPFDVATPPRRVVREARKPSDRVRLPAAV
jgi:hypothetical protein